jgi:hypothetical protein
MPWDSFRVIRLLSIPGKESISSYIYIFCNTQTGFLQVPGGWCTLKSLDEIHCSFSMINWETLGSGIPSLKSPCPVEDLAYSNLSGKCLRNNLLLYDPNYRFHKAATPIYTSMLTTDEHAHHGRCRHKGWHQPGAGCGIWPRRRATSTGRKI